jgi:hypothetical protein
MRALVVIGFVLSTVGWNIAFGSAPKSVSGAVFRRSGGIPSLRTLESNTIVLGTDGRLVSLMDETDSVLDPRWQDIRRFALTRNPGNGDYTYTKVDDTTGLLEMNFDGGGSRNFDLFFTSESAGFTDAEHNYGFSLTYLADFQNAPATSISTRGTVTPGHPMIVGFVVPGSVYEDPARQREVLIRAVGPSLSDFGVNDVWADPDFEVVRLGGVQTGRNPSIHGDWTTLQYHPYAGDTLVVEPNPVGVEAFRKIFDFVGAFQLADGSKDAVDFKRFGPGAYTVVASVGPNDPGGEALVEVYLLP